MYDSTKDTIAHIHKVRQLLNSIQFELYRRGVHHDASKLKEPEKSIIDQYAPLLVSMEFNSEEYNQTLNKISEMTKHHYKNNRHHPEHHSDGINGMNLIDVIEMFCDWAAASQRNKNGDIYKSLEICKERFEISDQLYHIFLNTIEVLK